MKGVILTKLLNEQWKIIDDYPNYAVSNFGHVKNVLKDEYLLCAPDPSTGYPCATLYNETGHRKFHVHALVARAFIPNPDSKRTVNHIDCNKENNIVTNLEWATDSEQMIHAFKNGLCEKTRSRASTNILGKPRNEWTEEDLEFVRNRLIAYNKRPKTAKQIEVARKRFSAPEFRKIVDESHYNRHPPIKVIETGEVWRSQRALAKHLGVSESYICAILHGRRKAPNDFHLEYIT